MKRAQQLSRRAVLGFGPVALTSCTSQKNYFGNTVPPHSQTLVYEISSEPSTFDPATMLGSGESSVMSALLECLVKTNPETLEPEAALGTHYEVNASLTEYVFYLRGHPNPKGTQLPGAAVPSAPAHWSDGAPVTAYDFALAWQRCVDPENALLTRFRTTSLPAQKKSIPEKQTRIPLACAQKMT